MVQILFVHGMGRSPLSGWPVLRRLRQAGMKTGTFSYLVSVQRFDTIVARLAETISALSKDVPLVLIGHSLGGVLIRAALARLASKNVSPQHVFLLASPQRASRMAQHLQDNALFRLLTGDCGELLANPVAMAAIPAIDAPVTSIVGTRPIHFNRAFGSEGNDGVVALSEVRAGWLTDEVQLALIHSVLPASRSVAQVILTRLAQGKTNSER